MRKFLIHTGIGIVLLFIYVVMEIILLSFAKFKVLYA